MVIVENQALFIIPCMKQPTRVSCDASGVPLLASLSDLIAVSLHFMLPGYIFDRNHFNIIICFYNVISLRILVYFSTDF